MTKRKPYPGKLRELNPYDKKQYPKHYKVANMLLTGKPVVWRDVYEQTGAGNRTLGVVMKDLAACSVDFEKSRNEFRETFYIASAPASAKVVPSFPLGAA